MRGYQQAPRVHEAKGNRIWEHEVKSEHKQTWGYEDAGMQVRVHEPEDMKM